MNSLLEKKISLIQFGKPDALKFYPMKTGMSKFHGEYKTFGIEFTDFKHLM